MAVDLGRWKEGGREGGGEGRRKGGMKRIEQGDGSLST
jgi:hypothetical protein